MAGTSLVAVHGGLKTDLFSPASITPDGSERLRVGLIFKNVDSESANAFVAELYDPESPNFRHWIDGTEYGRRFGATNADVAAITNYLRSQGFQNIYVPETHLYVSADGTLKQAEAAFHTKIASFHRPSELVEKGEPPLFFGPATSPMLPSTVADRVDAVIGLSNLVVGHHASTYKVSQSYSFEGYTPYDLSSGYNTDMAHSLGLYGQGMTIAIFSPTNFFPTDVSTFASSMTTSIAPLYENGYALTGYHLNQIKVDGGPAAGYGEGTSEASLDSETIVGQAPEATIDMIEGPSGTTFATGELDSYSEILKLKIPVVSSSWYTQEYYIIASGEEDFAVSFNKTAQALAAAGIGVFVCTDDHGAFSTNGAVVTTAMEASAQYVTAVGGTSLYLYGYLDANNLIGDFYWGETAWSYTADPNNPNYNWGGGGGISRLFFQPTWQAGPGVYNAYSDGMRQIPDVAADANSSTGYMIYTYDSSSGKHITTVIGGTSGATPLWASNALLIDEFYKGKLGQLAPALYWLGENFENQQVDVPNNFYVFNDITAGTNGREPATLDWDFCTGWGSVDFYKLLLDLGYAYKVTSILPDLQPYTPTGWKHPLMLSTSATAITEPTAFSHLSTYYVDLSWGNAIPTGGKGCDAPANEVVVEVNGSVVYSGQFSIGQNQYTIAADAVSLKFPAGTYTLKLIVNYGDTVRESSYANNTYVRTITVS
jgi:kumamolisin